MVEPAWSWTLHEQMPSSLEAGHQLIERLLRALEEHNWGGRDYFQIQMAAEEAMVNAVKHGNDEDKSKSVDVEFKVGHDWTFMRFQDQGEGFDPNKLPDPRDEEHLYSTNGRGVMLIKEMMSSVSYNDCGNEVIMLKQRSPDESATEA